MNNEVYRFIAISDIHLGWKLFNLPELADDLKDAFIRAIDLAISLKVTHIFIVGDLFDTLKPTPDLVKLVKDQVKKAGEQGILVTGCHGDHDKLVNNVGWMSLTGVIPVNDINDQRFVGYDYTDNSADNIDKISKLTYKDKVEWIFLHGHVASLFGFCAEKKLLDLNKLDLITNFPALKGVILGDIHKPVDKTIHDPSLKRKDLPYLGYCGSLGIVKTDEVDSKKGILYYDGTRLQRVPFSMDRKFIKFSLANSLEPINWVNKFVKFFREAKGKKPIFLITYDKASSHLLPQLAPLYDVGIVRIIMEQSFEGGVKETVNIRSELSLGGKVQTVLKELTSDKELQDFAFKLINSEDPTILLDQFKQKSIT